jgi:UDP-3-O-[3-hydroxymyristoyl] glucosamine N-acyltransferase
MEFTAEQIASLLNGEIEGNSKATVNKLSKIEEGVKNSISFLSNPAYTEFIYDSNASIVIVNKSFIPERALKKTLTLIKVDDARMAFAQLLELYQKMRFNKSGISAHASIGENTSLGENVYIGDFTSIGAHSSLGNSSKIYANCTIGENVHIGENCIIHAGVKLYDDTIIGNNCTVHSGAVIGADGFGFAPNSENKYQKVVHTGNVIIEDFVEIGANTCIDKATLGSTIIRKGVKLDNLIQIAHNVEVGENTVIASQTGIAGSTKIGKNCMIGGQVGIIGHLKIADGVKIAAQSGVGQSIEKEGEIIQGSPAIPIGEFKRSYVIFKHLPDLNNQLKDILKKITN